MAKKHHSKFRAICSLSVVRRRDSPAEFQIYVAVWVFFELMKNESSGEPSIARLFPSPLRSTWHNFGLLARRKHNVDRTPKLVDFNIVLVDALDYGYLSFFLFCRDLCQNEAFEQPDIRLSEERTKLIQQAGLIQFETRVPYQKEPERRLSRLSRSNEKTEI